jgi:hypothetical protein
MRKLAGTVAEDEEMKLLQHPSRRRCAGGCGCPGGAGARAGLGEEDAPSEGEQRRERRRMDAELRTAEKPGRERRQRLCKIYR